MLSKYCLCSNGPTLYYGGSFFTLKIINKTEQKPLLSNRVVVKSRYCTKEINNLKLFISKSNSLFNSRKSGWSLIN